MSEDKMVSVDKIRQVLISFCQNNAGNRLSHELINGLWVRLNTEVFGPDKGQDIKDEKGEGKK